MNGRLTTDVVFEGVEAPFRVHDADHILQLLPQIVTGWPFEQRPANLFLQPFFSVRSAPDDVKRVMGETHVQNKPARKLDLVNALCDMVATLPFALADADDRIICLHAAGVQFGDRLVVFPNIRRAGKSTLSCALAMAGHPVFGDDVLPTCFDTAGHAYGQAIGVAPRLRLPIPERLNHAFRTWVEETPGPRNEQYKYLSLSDQPAKGRMLRVRGFVVLDRQESPSAARLSSVSADDAMSALLHQNFTRDRHSADILAAIATTLSAEPCFRLTYFDLEDAVSCLETAFESDVRASGVPLPSEFRHFRMADLESSVSTKLLPDAKVRRCEGCLAKEIGGTLYLSDPEGRAIRRLDPLAAAIWGVLEEPTSVPDLEHLLCEAFPAESPDRIATDPDKLLRRLAKARLIASQVSNGTE